VAAARRGKLGEVGKSQKPLSDLELGLAKLKRELVEVKMGCGLAGYGIFVGIGRIKCIRRKFGLRCKQKRKFKATTSSKHTFPIAPNLLARGFTVLAPNRSWAGDITTIPTAGGWLYLKGLPSVVPGRY
jgi:hypothetical protein